MRKWRVMMPAVLCLSLALPAMAVAEDLCPPLTGSFKDSCTMGTFSSVCKVSCRYYERADLRHRNNDVTTLENGMCRVSNDKETYTMECTVPLKNDKGYLKPETVGLF